MLLWKPWLSGDLLLCQCSGTVCGDACEGIFPLLREKISRLAEHWEDYLNHLAFAMKT